MTEAEQRALMEKLGEVEEHTKRAVELAPKFEALETAIKERDTKSAELEKSLVEIREAFDKAEKEIEEIRTKARTAAIESDPAKDKRQAMRMLGMMVRENMVRAGRADMPQRFAGEAEELKKYREQRATLNADDTGGSYMIPTITESELIDTLEEVSPIISATDFTPGLPGKADIPTLTGRPTLQHKRATVDTAMTQSDPSIGRLQIDPDEGYVYFPIDNRLIQMSAVQLGTLSVNLLREAILEGLANDLLNGDGTSDYNSITGFLQDTTAAYIYTMGAGKTGFADLQKKNLTGAKAKCLKRGRARGQWVLSYDILGTCEDMDRTGKVPLLTMGPDGAYRMLQSPVMVDEGMPDLADSAKNTLFLGFGDLRTFFVGLVGGIQIATSDQYLFGYNQTAFRGVINYDIKRKPVATFVTIRTANA